MTSKLRLIIIGNKTNSVDDLSRQKITISNGNKLLMQ